MCSCALIVEDWIEIVSTGGRMRRFVWQWSGARTIASHAYGMPPAFAASAVPKSNSASLVPSRSASSCASSTELRNIGIMAHIDAGKTTVTERMLFYTGAERKLGDVDSGNTTTDFLAAERERGITIQSAAVSMKWNSTTINLIDTPGHVDFTFEVERALRVLDGAVAVLDGVAGAQVQTEKVWHQADRYGIQRIIFVNKLDRQGADLQKVLQTVRGTLRAEPLLTQLPIYGGDQGVSDTLTGVVDLVTMEQILWDPTDNSQGSAYHMLPIPEGDAAAAAAATAARAELVEKLAEYDDDLMEKYMEADCDASIEAVSPACIRSALRAVTAGQLLPRSGNQRTPVVVLCGAALRNIGIQPLLDAVVHYLPRPFEGNGGQQRRINARILNLAGNARKKRDAKAATATGTAGKNFTEVEVSADRTMPMRALAFKVVHDSRLQPVVFVRVYAGVLQARSVVTSCSSDSDGEAVPRKERVMKLLRVYADDMTEVEEVEGGNIAAIIGLKATRTGDTLNGRPAERNVKGGGEPGDVVLDPITIPPPVFFTAIESDSAEAAERLQEALQALGREDPSLTVGIDQTTGQLLVHGMGELHLEVVADRLRRDFQLGDTISVSPVRINYVEGVRVASEDITHEWRYEVPGAVQPMSTTITLRVEPVEEDDALAADEVTKSMKDQWGDDRPGNVAGINNQIDLSLAIEAADSPPVAEARAAIAAGIADAWSCGGLAGYRMAGVKVVVGACDWELTASNSVEALRAGAASAVAAACTSAAPGLQEPVMAVTISVDEEFVGVVLTDLTAQRRGVVASVEDAGSDAGRRVIHAEVPLSEMMRYATVLRSLTQGGGDFSMSLRRYAFVTAEKEAELVGWH